MTGIVGETASDGSLRSMLSALHTERWYDTERWTSGESGLALTDHGGKDPAGRTVWTDGDRAGVVYGVVSNLDSLPWAVEELFEAVLDRPTETLPRLDGPFLLAVVDADRSRACVATDKVASRPGYYAAADGFRFASELTPLLPSLDEPTVDVDAVGDLLSFGFVVGERTVVEGVRNLPPATCAIFDGEAVRTERYWYPEPRPTSGSYAEEWVDRHDRAIDRLSDGVDGRLGLWLSGGIDSRATAASLRRATREFTTFTYEAEADVAKRVADALGVEHRTFGPPDGEEFVRGVRRSVGVLDAMQAWSYAPAMGFMYDELADAADVVMEGGTFLGEDLWTSSLREPPVDAVYDRQHPRPPDEVAGLLDADADYDPRATVRSEVDACRGTDRRRALDTIRRFYAYTHMRSNTIQRSQVGTRVVADGRFLEHVLSMPDELRMGTLPFTDGRLPTGIPRIKLDVLREYGGGLDRIPYERTGVSPARHRWLHTAGFVAREAAKRVRPGTGSPFANPLLTLYRNDDMAREFLDGLLADARDRPFLDADGVEAYRERTLRGEESDITPIAAITGLELWLQEYVDESTSASTGAEGASRTGVTTSR